MEPATVYFTCTQFIKAKAALDVSDVDIANATGLSLSEVTAVGVELADHRTTKILRKYFSDRGVGFFATRRGSASSNVGNMVALSARHIHAALVALSLDDGEVHRATGLSMDTIAQIKAGSAARDTIVILAAHIETLGLRFAQDQTGRVCILAA